MKRSELISTINLLGRQLQIRGNGKTTLLKRGADGYTGDFLLITTSQAQARLITSNPRSKAIPLSSIERIRGYDLPILVDHEALREIIVGSSIQLNQMDFELHQSSEKYKSLERASSLLEEVVLNYLALIPWWKIRAKEKSKREMLVALEKYYKIIKSDGEDI
jgi:hypothetical protein